MAGSIFIEQLKRIWKHLIYWGIGLGLLSWMVMMIIPSADVLQEYAELIESMPPFLMQAFGASDMEALATPEGFIGLEIFSFVILLMAAYAVNAGLNIVSNDENDGAMDILLTLPVPRWRVILERFAAYSLIVMFIAMTTYIGLAIGNSMVELEVNMQVMAAASVNMIPVTLAIMAFTVFVAGWSPRRGLVLATSTLFVVLSYFVYTIGNAVNTTAANVASSLSVFHYYDHEAVVIDGMQWDNMLILLVIMALLVAVSLVTFERRDVGV
jgi:ABC-2 type transport system permease protein